MVVQQLAQLGGEALAVEQVANAQAATCHLVLVCRADTATGGADLGFAAGLLARLVEGDVIDRISGQEGLMRRRCAPARPSLPAW